MLLRIISITVVLLFGHHLYAQTVITGKVVGLHDGDTITVLDAQKRQYKIRLAAIDAPELKQAFGNKSKQNLSRLIFGQMVKIETSKTDRYGRIVGKVMFDGRDINLEQIKNGFAWHFKAYQREQTREDQDLYAGFERLARQFQLGLWIDAKPTPPWQYRHGPSVGIGAGIYPMGYTLPTSKIIGNRNSMI